MVVVVVAVGQTAVIGHRQGHGIGAGRGTSVARRWARADLGHIDRAADLRGWITGHIADVIGHAVNANQGRVHRIDGDDTGRQITIDIVAGSGTRIVIGSTQLFTHQTTSRIDHFQASLVKLQATTGGCSIAYLINT